METHSPEIDKQVVGGTNNFVSVPGELSVQDVIINNNQNKNENEIKNENFNGTELETIRKSVSWAKDENLVELYEIEEHRRKSFSYRILDRLCCKSKSKEKIIRKTEQIRRINRLFASDSLFLRDSLKIPVSRELANSYETNHCHSGSVSDTLTSSVSTESFTDEEDKSVNDFFGKIDNSIAGIRDQVKEVQKHSSVLDSTKTAGMLTKNHYKKQPHPTTVSSNNDVFVTPHPVVLNRGRKVKSSLQRLEKEQDELFEL